MKLTEIETTLKNEIETFPFMKEKYSYNSSTQEFENKSGISVTQKYKMPDNLSVKDVYRYVSSVLAAVDRRKIEKAEADSRINFVYDSIERLNPELKSIDSNFQDAGRHVLTAVLSQFNIDDIEGYVTDGKTNRWYINQPNWDDRYQKISKIEKLTGARIYWVMSDKTLDRVYDEVSKKYKNKI